MMTNDKADYLTVLMTMQDELQQEKPIPAILESCREFLVKMPLPLEELKNVPTHAEWGHA